jgi:general stress protein 26
MFGKDESPETHLRKEFWKALQGDRTLMLGLHGVDDDLTRPMTAQVDLPEDGDKEDGGPIYFFASRDEGIGKDFKEGARAIATFASKGHGLFASIHGTLHASNDRAVIERLWNPFVDAWYKDGKDDPVLLLLRFKAKTAEVWDADKFGTLKATALKWAFDVDPGEKLDDEHRAKVTL